MRMLFIFLKFEYPHGDHNIIVLKNQGQDQEAET